jgi:hypothetical protein
MYTQSPGDYEYVIFFLCKKKRLEIQFFTILLLFSDRRGEIQAEVVMLFHQGNFQTISCDIDGSDCR